MIWIPLSITLSAVIILLVSVSSLILITAFRKRSDNDPNLKYFTYLDFPEIEVRPVCFKSGKNALRGYLYSTINCKGRKLIVFNHGFGAGHEAYTRLIRDLVIHGFFVLAYDYTGCQMSEGKSMKGLSQPLYDFRNALKYIKSEPKLSKMDLYTVGHSWGGLVSASALRIPEVKKIVSIAPINGAVSGIAAKVPQLRFLTPFMYIANFLMFGSLGNFTIKGAVRKSRKPFLMMGGKNDPLVKIENGYGTYQLISRNNPLAEYYIDENKYHNPFLSREGEKYLYETFKTIGWIYKEKKTAENKEFFASVDYDLITEDDPVFINKIVDFLNS